MDLGCVTLVIFIIVRPRQGWPILWTPVPFPKYLKRTFDLTKRPTRGEAILWLPSHFYGKRNPYSRYHLCARVATPAHHCTTLPIGRAVCRERIVVTGRLIPHVDFLYALHHTETVR